MYFMGTAVLKCDCTCFEVHCHKNTNFCNTALLNHSSESALVFVGFDFLYLTGMSRRSMPSIAVN